LSIDDIRPALPVRKAVPKSRYLLYIAAIAALISLLPIGNTLSTYFDGEISPANIFSAGQWDGAEQDQAQQDAPLIIQVSEPQSFSASLDTPPAETPDDMPPVDMPTDTTLEAPQDVPADPPVVVSDPVTVITEPEVPADTPPADVPAEAPSDTSPDTNTSPIDTPTA